MRDRMRAASTRPKPTGCHLQDGWLWSRLQHSSLRRCTAAGACTRRVLLPRRDSRCMLGTHRGACTGLPRRTCPPMHRQSCSSWICRRRLGHTLGTGEWYRQSCHTSQSCRMRDMCIISRRRSPIDIVGLCGVVVPRVSAKDERPLVASPGLDRHRNNRRGSVLDRQRKQGAESGEHGLMKSTAPHVQTHVQAARSERKAEQLIVALGLFRQFFGTFTVLVPAVEQKHQSRCSRSCC